MSEAASIMALFAARIQLDMQYQRLMYRRFAWAFEDALEAEKRKGKE